ncbi:tetrahydrofolate dehydrogenase/cyclohydrolase catalytic domain-containing protein [candidate division KSB1 bacterium]
MADIINGKEISDSIRTEIADRVEKLSKVGIIPGLAVILAGDDPASHVYVRMKEKACEKTGIYSVTKRMPETVTQDEIEKYVLEFNNDPKIHGILVQHPLPYGIDEPYIFSLIDPNKDVDGFHPVNVGKFVTSIEIVPPRGWDISEIIQKTEILKKSGIDCINVPDGPRASARMSPQVMSYLVQKKVGIEVILHYCCRDRNLLGMQSDILGNFSAGIKNLLIITGDPPKVGDYPDATAVFDVDSIGLTRIVNNLNHGYDIGGNAIGRPTSYFIGVGSNPNAVDLNREINRFFQKVEAGAEYAITQPVFDPESFFSYLEKIKDTNIPIIAGIWPLISYRNADFMKHEVPGVYVPDHILERMKVPSSKEESLEEGIKIAREILSTIKDHVSGVQVSSPFGHIEYSLQVLKDIIL